MHLQLDWAGDYPNVNWQAITWEELRAHPSFAALPQIEAPVTADDFSKVRQGTAAWGALHDGRLTTSTAAAALGFYESASAKMLGVPRSLASRQRACNAFLHLKSGAPAGGYEEAVNEALFMSPNHDRQRENASEVWKPHGRLQTKAAASFALKYCVASERTRRGRPLSAPRRFYSSSAEVRMAWGTAQEATALLAVLNLLSGAVNRDQSGSSGGGASSSTAAAKGEGEGGYAGRLALSEAGMFSGGPLDPNQPHGVMLGASPDAVLRRGSASGEALAVVEVKCRCPFADADFGQPPRKSTLRKRFQVADRGPSPTLAPWHVPQLMLHMHCVGCASAWLLTLSATRGATLLLLPRDDDYLREMLHFLRLFVSTFLAADRMPTPDFFQEQHRYRSFVAKTKRLAASARVINVLEQAEVQRGGGAADRPFLDEE